MNIVQALLGEHGAMYPLLDLIEATASSAGIDELRMRVHCLRSILISHAELEETVLRPAIASYLPRPALAPDGSPAATDHDIIRAGLSRVLDTAGEDETRRLLLETIAFTRRHFRKEETVMFGIAERELSRDLQDQLGAEWAARRGVFVN
jgi:hemerythrin-like domain-containing protein